MRRRLRTAVLAGTVALGLMGLAAQPASAAFGDGFGIAPPLGPALPGPTSFWAGTCVRAEAPAVGEPIPGGEGGGVGVRPPSMLTKFNETAYINPDSPGQVDVVASPATPAHCIDHGAPVQGWPAWADSPAGEPVEGAPQWRLPSSSAAGGHPDGSATFTFAREANRVMTAGSVDNVIVDLPAGVVGNPTAVGECTLEQFDANPVQCPPSSQVGIAEIALRHPVNFAVQSRIHPIYNLEPRRGKTAEFGIPDVASFTPVRVVARARTNGDFGVTTMARQIPSSLDLYAQTITLWGVPWAASNDKWRLPQGSDVVTDDGLVAGIPQSGLPPEEQAPYDPSWGPIRPFISIPTECSGLTLETRLTTDSYQKPGAFTSDDDPLIPLDPSATGWFTTTAAATPVTDCEEVPFDPELALEPTSSNVDSATGLRSSLTLPQNNDPPQATDDNPNLGHDPSDDDGAPHYWRTRDGRATSHLNKAVVTLPVGMSLNPAGAKGLKACSDAGIGLREDGSPPLFNNQDPFDGVGPVECPQASKIGTVTVETPLLEERLSGVVVLGEPRSTDPQSGEMFRVFLVVRNDERGLLAKIAGSAKADPSTGQLTATFDKNPRVPFENMRIEIKGGPNGVFATPQRCGAASWSAGLTPWSAPGSPVAQAGSFAVAGNCDLKHTPSISASMSRRDGGTHGAFSFRIRRADGQQWLRYVTTKMPAGLIAMIRVVPRCPSAQAASGNCPAASRVGTVDAGAGAGAPYYLERKGDVYLTDGYKGGEFGLLVRVRVEAGPFRGPWELTPIVVRQALHVDPTTAQVTVVSDPLPTVWHGIPLRTREITVKVDRGAFMRNPTDCSPKEIVSTIGSTEGVDAVVRTPFRAANCGRLGFRPRLGLRLIGKRQTRTGRHPAIQATMVQAEGQANIKKVQVTLPRSLALDAINAYDPKLVCDYDIGLAAKCPASSIIGEAHLRTPVLKEPLTGPVHLVQGIRLGPNGNIIRTLPTLLVKLRGEVEVHLRGRTSVNRRAQLVSTFSNIPDAPAARFAMRIRGGKKGIITITSSRRGPISICSGRQLANVDVDAQNGRRFDRVVRVSTPCKAAKRKTAKRKAKRGKGKRVTKQRARGRG